MNQIHQNLENIEKYLMVAQLENTKMNAGNKSSGIRFRSCLLNISKECAEARRLSLETKHGLKQAEPVEEEENVPSQAPPVPVVVKARGRKPKVAPQAMPDKSVA